MGSDGGSYQRLVDGDTSSDITTSTDVPAPSPQQEARLSTLPLALASRPPASTPAAISAAPTPSKSTTATPLPRTQVLLIGLILYAATFPQNVLFPFLPFMVAHFNPELSTSQLGYRAGVIAAAFSVGTFFSSYIFGRLADRYGRKGCVCLGLLGTVGSSLLFGLSPSFPVAVTARLLAGLLCGNNGLSKTMISEITDDSNSAFAFSLVGTMDGLARLSAPSVGGFLSMPNAEYGWDIAFFADFPFFLPCFASAAVSAIALAAVLPLLRETLPASIRAANTKRMQRLSQPPHLSTEADRREEQLERLERQQKSVRSLLSHRPIAICIALNCCLMVLAVIINEGVPLWVVNDSQHFGFGFSSSAIGTIFTVLGPMQAITNLFIFPRVVQRFGYLATFRYCLSVVCLLCLIMPFIYYLSFSQVLVWIGLLGLFTLLVMHRSSGFTACFVLLNNTADNAQKASANGLAMSFASLAGVISPVVGGSVLAWSIEAGLPWPLDHSAMWMLCAVVAVIGWILIGKLPESANHKKQQAESSTKIDPAAAAAAAAEVEMRAVAGGRGGGDGVGAVTVTVNGGVSEVNGIGHQHDHTTTTVR